VTEQAAVAIEVATPAEAPVLENLLELYLHDLSDVFALEVGGDGRFGYERLPLYWTQPERRFPFLIRQELAAGWRSFRARSDPPRDSRPRCGTSAVILRVVASLVGVPNLTARVRRSSRA
jgi:hypothetical protein